MIPLTLPSPTRGEGKKVSSYVKISKKIVARYTRSSKEIE